MLNSHMPYQARSEVPSLETYRRLRHEAGLSDKSVEAATIGLSNGLFSVLVYHGDEPVGMGRVIGDGGCFFVICDIAVTPTHQKKGVGDLIMKTLVAWLRENAPSSAYVSLMASHGTPHFYERYGFEIAHLPERAGMFLRMP